MESDAVYENCGRALKISDLGENIGIYNHGLLPHFNQILCS